MMNLPLKFQERMKAELKEDYSAFLSVYDRPPYKAIRVNTLKISVEEFEKISPFPLGERVEWERNAFYVTEEKVGRSPYHFAGLYYSQEPSAMSAAPLLEVKEGECVLDLCSAPGGKGTQMAQNMKGKGIIVLNEYVAQRAKILSSNVERMGISNAVVLSEDSGRLAEKFPLAFDKILVDAPCSGEGMFKKNEEEAVSNWSEENVALCARRQREILDNAAKMLKGGGLMVYSTCTFSPEEDEGQTQDFLSRHSDFSLVKERKIYPHLVKGEGHYTALFKKNGEEERVPKSLKCGIPKREEGVYREWESAFLNEKKENFYLVKDALYSMSEGTFDFKGLNVLRAGVRLGELIGGRFEPSHSFAMTLKREACKNFVSLNEDEAVKYLRGETLPTENKNGWCVVGVGDYPLGWGKISGGIVKNHYPKGLRILSKNS